MTPRHVFSLIAVLVLGIGIGTAQTYTAFHMKDLHNYFNPIIKTPTPTASPSATPTLTATPTATLTPTVYYRRPYYIPKSTLTPTPSI